MPPHPEVPAALRKLRDAGFRLFTLTNNLPENSTPVSLTMGGIADLFERHFSADGAKTPQAVTSGLRLRRKESLGLAPPGSALSPVIHGIRLVPSQPVGKPR